MGGAAPATYLAKDCARQIARGRAAVRSQTAPRVIDVSVCPITKPAQRSPPPPRGSEEEENTEGGTRKPGNKARPCARQNNNKREVYSTMGNGMWKSLTGYPRLGPLHRLALHATYAAHRSTITDTLALLLRRSSYAKHTCIWDMMIGSVCQRRWTLVTTDRPSSPLTLNTTTWRPLYIVALAREDDTA
ncbi:hypothetical protein LX36DRAFT_659594 [Colletotrichum falcatum]|nr:hypothetical protein LX36DRAFT_659594 [Colletotrichum falcatum]